MGKGRCGFREASHTRVVMCVTTIGDLPWRVKPLIGPDVYEASGENTHRGWLKALNGNAEKIGS